MSGHLALKPFMLFLALILSLAWSIPAISASDAKKDKNTAASDTKKDKPKKPASEAPKKSESTKKSEMPHKAEESKKAEESSTKRDEAAKKVDESDPLQACLAKIPTEATFGQRLLAEQSCNREDERRNQSGSAARF